MGRNGRLKYKLSDLNFGGSGKLYNYFEVIKIEAWNSKNCELNHHLHSPNYPNQWAAPWLLEPWRSYVVVKSLMLVVIVIHQHKRMIHTLTNRCYPLVKDDTLMNNHLEGKEKYSGNTSYLIYWFGRRVGKKQFHCLKNKSLEVVQSAFTHEIHLDIALPLTSQGTLTFDRHL